MRGKGVLIGRERRGWSKILGRETAKMETVSEGVEEGWVNDFYIISTIRNIQQTD